MNTRPKSVAYRIAAAVTFASIINVQPALGQSELSDAWKIAEGGRLYDHWSKVVNYDTKNLPTHPAYPSTSKQKGEGTWRCKECHGWDFRGKDGAYAKGSRFTGIKGIREFAGVAPDRIASVIRNKTHGYTEAMIPNQALSNIALFVSSGQLDTDKHVDRATKKALGDSKRGARFYQTVCAICHGFDGKQINFKKPEDPEFIGTVANENPWEALHKIRNGQPGAPMISLGVLDVQDQVDLLSYAQTLPQK